MVNIKKCVLLLYNARATGNAIISRTERETDRPIMILFLLMSVDRKISTGATDNLDVDKDFPKLVGVKEGLHH